MNRIGIQALSLKETAPICVPLEVHGKQKKNKKSLKRDFDKLCTLGYEYKLSVYPIAQLVEHCTEIAKVRVRITKKA